MRLIETHRVNGLNEALTLAVIDEKGPGNANHFYQISFLTPVGPKVTNILFQKGPIKEAGVNGISNEVLLAIVRDRLDGFQSGDFKCEQNETALVAVDCAMKALLSRTKERVERGVEGTSEK